MSSFPSGTVTFLFTDIEGSTKLAQQYPDAMPALLAWHREVLQKAIQTQDGYIFQVVGDSFSAAFHSAGEAVHAALDAQIQLHRADWTSVPLKVRMGIHTGAATLVDDPNIEGPYAGYSTLALTQRVMSAAHGGQTLLSQSTYELTRDAMAENCQFIDMGEHHLKSILRPVRLYQLDAPDLPRHFPPLKTLNYSPHNLPEQLTSFIGREKEISDIKHLLQSARLVTLTGSGGTGKTRLSQEVGAQELTNFAHGVWFIELASLTDPSQIIPAMAQVFGLQEVRSHSLVNIILDYLRDKTMLLILDNCEHLIEACARLADDLLHQCARLKILASSREALGIAGELAYPVPSLAAAESTQLFLERARAVNPNFKRTESNASSVDQICSRLDGIPLAIELAAARIKLLSPEQIAARLDDRFRLLVGGSRTALPRQQTLRALIDWSYDLLSEPERSALVYVSVFAGGWTFEAAEAVLGPDGLELLSALVDKSLVVIEETANGEKRYNLLETIRQYARERLIESGRASTARELHLGYFLQLAAEAESKLMGPQMLEALNLLEPELDNIRTALGWVLERNPETALRLAVSLTYFWHGRGHITEGRLWLSEALSRWEALTTESSRDQQVLMAKALWSNGVLSFAQGELIAARSALTESARLARQASEPSTLVMALGMLGFTVVWLGDATTAEAVIEEGTHVAKAINYELGTGQMLMVQANQAASLQHDFTAARAYGEEGLRIMREVGNPFFTAIAIMGLGSVALARGNYAEARTRLEESERLFYELGDRHMALGVQSQRAHIERQLGNYPRAVELYHQSILAWRKLGHRVSLAHEFECLAFIACRQSQPHRAARLLGAAASIRESLNSPMTATERIEYDQNVLALRAQMDESYLQQAWAEGRAMVLEQAVEYALEDVDS
jgi:predicted ATPase/class 3 adenylate cyclase